jgi:HTH-type transcriptional regulator, sugar sensing transcriptional regulator
MLDSEHEMAEMLTKYGFSSSETRLYLEMLRKQEVSAGELHRVTGQSRPRTYELINQMVLKGFCQQRVEGRRKFYSAIKPSRLRDLMQQKWEQEQKREEELFAKMDDVYDGGRDNNQSIDFIEVIRTKDMINQSFVNLVNDAQMTIQAFVRRPFSGLNKENWQAQKDALENANARGVAVHAIYSTEDMSTEVLQRAFVATEELEKSLVRFKSSLPAKMFVFDSKKVLLAIPSIPGEKVSDFTMMVLEDESNATVYSELFSVYWGEALEYEDWRKENSEIQS